MRAVFIEAFDADVPTAAVRVGERPAPEPPAGWTLVDVKAAALNHHDLWTLRGSASPRRSCPMILGCDAAGWTRTATRSSCTA